MNKKIFNPVSNVKPQPIDCCHVVVADRTIPAAQWLSENNMLAELCGLSALQHVKDGYALFYADERKVEDVRFNGLFRSDGSDGNQSQDVCLSSIPKGLHPRAWLVFNKDEYSRRRRDFHEYRNWEQSRNQQRYQGTLEHGGGYDAKNMMHTFRLLRMAKEIADTGRPKIRRPDRDELLAIKAGRYSYEDLIAKASAELKKVDESFALSALPDEPDVGQIERWAVEIRKAWYANMGRV